MNIGGSIYLGVVESRHDPLKLGRHQVRVFGVHSEKITDIPTDSLPWAITISTGSMSGIGSSPIYIEGTVVYLFFQDGDSKQMPVIIGSMQGAPMEKTPFPGGDQAEEDPGFVIPTETRVIPVDAKVEPEYTYSGASYLDEIKSQSSDSDGSSSSSYVTSSIFSAKSTIISSYEQAKALIHELGDNFFKVIDLKRNLGGTITDTLNKSLSLISTNQQALITAVTTGIYPFTYTTITEVTNWNYDIPDINYFF